MSSPPPPVHVYGLFGPPFLQVAIPFSFFLKEALLLWVCHLSRAPPFSRTVLCTGQALPFQPIGHLLPNKTPPNFLGRPCLGQHPPPPLPHPVFLSCARFPFLPLLSFHAMFLIFPLLHRAKLTLLSLGPSSDLRTLR